MRQLTHPPATTDDCGVALSPDGRTLVFVRMVAWGASDIYLLPLTGELLPEGEPVRLTFEGQWTTGPAWMPDGREIVFALGTFRGSSNLRRIPADGGEEAEILRAFDHSANCSVTDQGIYFVPVRNEAGGGFSVIRFYRFAKGKIEDVTAIDKYLYHGLTVSPEGRWLLYSQIDQSICDLMLVEDFR